MIYLSSFKLSDKKVNNPNIYPYNVFRGKYIDAFVFSPITVLYGNNGSFRPNAFIASVKTMTVDSSKFLRIAAISKVKTSYMR